MLRQFREYPAAFPLDFTPDFLDHQPLERLQHLFVAVCLQSQQMPHGPGKGPGRGMNPKSNKQSLTQRREEEISLHFSALGLCVSFSSSSDKSRPHAAHRITPMNPAVRLVGKALCPKRPRNALFWMEPTNGVLIVSVSTI